MATKTTVDFGQLTENLKSLFVELFPTVSTGEWTSWNEEDQKNLRAVMAKLNSVRSKLQPTFDQTVWNGHDNGAVSVEIESIRARRREDAQTPGRKAVPKTADDIFASL